MSSSASGGQAARHLWTLGLLLTLSACPNEVPDSGQFAGDAADVATNDATVAALSDSAPADSGPADSGPADSGPADSGPADSGPADTATADAFDSGTPCGCASDPDCDLAVSTCQKVICKSCTCLVVLADDGAFCATGKVCAAGKCVAGPSNGPWAKALAAAGDQSCVIRIDNSVTCWGRNSHGQLGSGDTKVVVGTQAVPGLSNVSHVALGQAHVCALHDGGLVSCWGERFYGQTGAGNKSGDAVKPEAAKGITDALQLSAGVHSSLAVRKGQTLWAWGSNAGGLSLSGVYTAMTVPEQVKPVLDVSLACAGDQHACVVGSAATVRCWGRNTWGQLGFGVPDYSSPPVAPGEVKGLSGVVGIACGSWHTCAWNAVGGAWCWGKNLQGQVGLGNKDVDAIATPQPVKGLADAKMMAAGQGHTCTVRKTGVVACWGGNSFGESGLAPAKDVLALNPVDVGGKASSVAAGEDHSCALREDGSVWCWGENKHGQLGDGGNVDSHAPVLVVGSAQKK